MGDRTSKRDVVGDSSGHRGNARSEGPCKELENDHICSSYCLLNLATWEISMGNTDIL